MHQAFQLEGRQGIGNRATSPVFRWTKTKTCARLKVAFKKHVHLLVIRG